MTRLSARADFAHTPGLVCLWFEDTDGRALTMQDLYNLALRRDSEQWHPDDQMLLKLLWQEVSKPAVLKGNLKVLKITRRKFDGWLLRFEDSPDRFAHADGGSVRNDLISGKLRLDLGGGGETVTIAAMVDLPNGDSCCWHELRFRPQGKQACFLRGDELIEIDLPIPREKLDQVFGKGPQQVPTAAVPKLFSKRLDLLSGSALDRRQDAEARLILEDDGADILLRVQGSSFRHEKGRLRLNLPPAKIQDALHQISSESEARIQGRPDIVSTFVDKLRALPEEIAISASPALQGILADGSCESELTIQQGSGWLDVDLACRVNGTLVSGDELQTAIDSGHSCLRTRSGNWLRLPASVAIAYRERLAELNLAPGRQRLAAVNAAQVFAKFADYPDLRPRADASRLIESLQGLQDCPIEDDRLRDYQREGVQFIYERLSCEMGCLLADDMGLGKTAQALVTTRALFRQGQASHGLVVCPASVLAVWKREAATFAPELRVAVLDRGPDQRRAIFANSANWDLAVMSYAVVRNDFQKLRKLGCELLILDEAQAIKNPDAAVTQAVRRLEIPLRLAITGTPLENTLDDLWSIGDVLNPGYFGELRDFRLSSRQRLAAKLSPLILRRVKAAVAPELPPRSEEVLRLPMSSHQAEFYQTELLRARQTVATQSVPEVLAAITRLRQICCDPRLVADFDAESAKVQVLRERIFQLHEAGHSVLVFSQFTRMLDLVAAAFAGSTIPLFSIRGETPAAKRAALVDEFSNSKEAAVFLLSLRAAGTGLTLTKADYVFICDPWWNPAIENQAIDRTHRIGQGQPVTAYRLVMADSIEEKVVDMQADKQALFTQIVDGAADLQQRLTSSQLAEILAEE